MSKQKKAVCVLIALAMILIASIVTGWAIYRVDETLFVMMVLVFVLAIFEHDSSETMKKIEKSFWDWWES